jgi:hypothetical protein
MAGGYIWVMEKKTTQARRILVAIDQLFNALSWGNEDVTLSGRLYYLHDRRNVWIASFLMHVVDNTFYPIDGPNHCMQAFEKDSTEKYMRGNDFGLALVSLFVVLGCIILIFPIMITAAVRFIRS